MQYRIAVIKGDGIGPEIVTEAMLTLEKVGEKFGHTFDFLSFFHLMGGRKKQKESFTEPARRMLDSLFTLPETVTLRAYFSIGEMILEDITSGTAENRRLIPCEAFECAVETDGLYLLAYAGKGIILPKNCLTDGTDERFRAFLNSRTIVADLTARPADNS